jgi:hypothetical protein
MKLGFLPDVSLRPGPLAIMAKSGTLSYEVGYRLAATGLGQSLWVGVGGDPVKGMRFADLLPLFVRDDRTSGIVLIGEVGGNEEEEVGEANTSKPVYAVVAGRGAKEGVSMGHAGALVFGDAGTFASKRARLEQAGARVFDTIEALVSACRRDHPVRSSERSASERSKRLLGRSSRRCGRDRGRCCRLSVEAHHPRGAVRVGRIERHRGAGRRQEAQRGLGPAGGDENRAGAGGTIGAAAVAAAAPDGHTLLLVSSTFTINAAIKKNLPFDSLRDFAPVAFIARSPLLLTVSNKLPAADVNAFVALAKSRAVPINYASLGPGSINQIAAELIAAAAGIRLMHVPYKGGAPALNDLVGGHVDVYVSSLPQVLEIVRSGAAKGLAVTGARRSPSLPDVPTLEESGVPGAEAASGGASWPPLRPRHR